MNSKMRSTLKWGGRALVALALILAIPISALAFPYPFFEHSGKFGHCVVYSDEEWFPGFDAVMRDVNMRLESVDLLPAGSENRIFLCRSQKRYSTLARISRVNPNVQGFNLSIFGNTFVSVPRVDYTRMVSGGLPRYGVREGDLAHVIAHEVIHDLCQNRIGFINYLRLPVWKREGYAEYGAVAGAIRRAGGPGLKERIPVLLNDCNWYGPEDYAKEYYRGELLVEYLSDIEGLTFEQIMSDDVVLNEAHERMMKWYGAGIR